MLNSLGYRLIILAVTAAALGACGENSTKTDLASVHSNTLADFRVFVSSRCAVTQKISPISQESLLGSALALIKPSLIEKVIGLAGSKLKDLSGKDVKATTLTASTPFYFYNGKSGNKFSLHKDFRCITIVKDSFTSKVAPIYKCSGVKCKSLKATNPWITYLQNTNGIDILTLTKYKLSDNPSFYSEAIVELSNKDTHIKIKPVFIYYGKRLGNSGHGNKGGISLLYSLYSPGKTSNEAFAVGNYGFKALRPGKVYTKPILSSKSTDWMNLKTISKTDKAPIYKPANLNIQVTETNKINKYLLILSEAITENKRKLYELTTTK